MSNSTARMRSFHLREQGTDDALEMKQRRKYDRAYVQSLFDGIAPRYDALNHLLSFGLDIVWRRKAIKLLRPHRPERILDCATGTGDLAIEAARLAPRRIVGIDVSEAMLKIAREKVEKRHLGDLIELRLGEAEHLEFGSDSFDAVTVAFGVRNYHDLHRGLAEMARVLRPGGVALILEFSRPRRFPVKQLYALYSKHILPIVGGLISKRRDAYEYLPSTVGEFPDGKDFLRLVQAAGFASAVERRLTFGIATIYLASK
jgi:demethylmenaquinone methyltransferase/2-methoxy-6-polyprenyl-1,4-benzoquinol methylase